MAGNEHGLRNIYVHEQNSKCVFRCHTGHTAYEKERRHFLMSGAALFNEGLKVRLLGLLPASLYCRKRKNKYRFILYYKYEGAFIFSALIFLYNNCIIYRYQKEELP